MAIVWSTQYPGQVSVDPNWPHGKPRNVAVPGDGSGTPLEAAWVSDLAGWQAALLAEAGIAPSGQPDHLGASDYTAAIKAIAGGGLAGFTSTEHTWTAQQTFTTNVPVGGEVVYTAPKTRTVLLPVSAFASEGNFDIPLGGYAATWGLVYQTSGTPPVTSRLWTKPLDAPAKKLVAEFALPTNASLQSIRMSVGLIGSAPSLDVSLGRAWTTVFGDSPSCVYEELGSQHITATGIYDLAATPQPIDGAIQNVYMTFLAPAGQSAQVHWVRATFTDPGPRNY